MYQSFVLSTSVWNFIADQLEASNWVLAEEIRLSLRGGLHRKLDLKQRVQVREDQLADFEWAYDAVVMPNAVPYLPLAQRG